MQSVLPPHLLLAPLPDSADCPVASVISRGVGGELGDHPPSAQFPWYEQTWVQGPTCAPRKWALRVAAGLRPLFLLWAFPGGQLGKPRPAQESGDPASPKVELKGLERNLKRLKE